MLSRDQCQRPNRRTSLGFSGVVFGSTAAPVESTTSRLMSLLHGGHPVPTVDASVFRTWGKLVTQERKDDFFEGR